MLLFEVGYVAHICSVLRIWAYLQHLLITSVDGFSMTSQSKTGRKSRGSLDYIKHQPLRSN